ncbi:hypothetical protein GUITHDRAFT_103774 [Guillardia theta CCMP2712]|uniref:SMB domain-containing protein n=1 Tax=Guillardia theta (strain CCMP2712) TaxID=905079 RepID=L1JPM6_GUITC|nr:hypothetical protein GUITHDRAFT_103774 [Guillardia theta CCMP2712]EKX50546.1 hypothetical protein GUITHDRAFT_103774 [Guillardia theta CCMP2712]|eukprot:XP_005837526.1 hypothetical protein GUITHDRAFT_103774 [Guillardia theta CCMP2712]
MKSRHAKFVYVQLSLRYLVQGSCNQTCGAKAVTCWCDELCHSFGDCCPDKCLYCFNPLCSNSSASAMVDNSTHSPPTVPVCGDGVISGSEVCDDGNTVDGDACSADCSTVNDMTYDCSDPIFSGIQLDYSVDNLRHCELCFDVLYDQGNVDANVERCKSREYLVLAAMPVGESPNVIGSNLTLAAIFRSSNFNKTTSKYEAVGPEFGTWRYWVNQWSMGFAPSSQIQLMSADVWHSNYNPSDPASSDCKYRLSWHWNYGGWRVGCTTGLNFDEQWRKQMYSCPQSWSCRPRKQKCVLTATWDEIVHELTTHTGRFVAGGLGYLMERGVRETWLCQYGHECAPKGDAMCFMYNEETKSFEVWDLLSVLKLL